jgi:outer membrane protein assembly factor BamB
VKWEFRHPSPTRSGSALSTAGGLVFTGDAEGNFVALDAATGRPLGHFQMGAVYASPMAFEVDGKEYIGIAAGSSCTRLVYRRLSEIDDFDHPEVIKSARH